MNATRQAYTEQYRLLRKLSGGPYFKHFKSLSNDEKHIARAAIKSYHALQREHVSYNPHQLRMRKQENEAAQKRAEAEGLLNEAKTELESAIRKIEQAVKGTSEENAAHSYIIPHLKSWVTDEHESIENLIGAIVYPEDETA